MRNFTTVTLGICQWWQVPVSNVFGTWPLQYYVRLFPHPHRRFGLFQFVAMSTLVRVALPVSEFISCHK
jgi:hypothetical protein